MDVQNIRLLHEKPYRVSWKADGTRYVTINTFNSLIPYDMAVVHLE